MFGKLKLSCRLKFALLVIRRSLQTKFKKIFWGQFAKLLNQTGVYIKYHCNMFSNMTSKFFLRKIFYSSLKQSQMILNPTFFSEFRVKQSLLSVIMQLFSPKNTEMLNTAYLRWHQSLSLISYWSCSRKHFCALCAGFKC